MIFLLTLTARAHDDGTACPPFPAIEKFAALGQMSSHHEACLTRAFPSLEMTENQAWVLWLGRWKSTQNTRQRDVQAQQLIAASQVPDRLLWSATLLAEEAPDLAKQAIARAETQVLRWSRLSHRLQQIQVLFRLKTRLDPEHAPIQWVQSLRNLGVTGAYLVEAETACLAVADADTCGKEVETGWLALDANSSWNACSNTAHLTVQRMESAHTVQSGTV